MTDSQKIFSPQHMGGRIRETRLAHGLQQKDLADKLGYKSQTSVSKIETGEKTPTADVLMKLHTVLNVDIHWLVTGEKYPQDNPLAEFGDLLSSIIDKTIGVVSSELIGLLREKAERSKDLNAIESAPDKNDAEIQRLGQIVGDLHLKERALMDQIHQFNDLLKRVEIIGKDTRLGPRVVVTPLPKRKPQSGDPIIINPLGNNDLRHNGNP